MESRYDGKPLLRVLEMYILWAINELPAEYLQPMQQMTLHLQSTYQMLGTWQEIIAAVMEFPDSLPDALRKLWAENCKIAEEHGAHLEPQMFAEMIADKNFLS